MAFTFKSFDEAHQQSGIKMVVVGNIPSPWSEAAKNFLHLKRINWTAIRFDPRNEALTKWMQANSAPTLIDDHTQPLTGWHEILQYINDKNDLCPLIPDDETLCNQMFDLANKFMGQNGLCWNRRLQFIELGLALEGQQKHRAQYLAKKYGYTAHHTEVIQVRLCELLTQLTDQLKHQHSVGSQYLLGEKLTAVDVYCAVSMSLFAPLPEVQCPMDPTMRQVFSNLNNELKRCVSAELLQHRNHIYQTYLSLPLSL